MSAYAAYLRHTDCPATDAETCPACATCVVCYGEGYYGDGHYCDCPDGERLYDEAAAYYGALLKGLRPGARPPDPEGVYAEAADFARDEERDRA